MVGKARRMFNIKQQFHPCFHFIDVLPPFPAAPREMEFQLPERNRQMVRYFDRIVHIINIFTTTLMYNVTCTLGYVQCAHCLEFLPVMRNLYRTLTFSADAERVGVKYFRRGGDDNAERRCLAANINYEGN